LRLTTQTFTAITMADPRFILSDEFGASTDTSSILASKKVVESESPSDAEEDQASEQHSDQEVDVEDNGMDADGFAGPKVVKPLTPEALAAFKATQERAGVIYISRIPPGMQPTKVRHLMSQHGEVGRVYLQKEGMKTSMHCWHCDLNASRCETRVSAS
jgi:ESF2/ABP1 family protein